MFGEKLEAVKEESARLRNEMRERTVGFIAAALGLVAGLAWNDAIKAGIEYLFPLGQNTLFAKFAYAIIVTLIAVVVTMSLVRFIKKEGEK